MAVKEKQWAKTSPWGDYLKDSTSKEADKRREIGANGTRNNNKRHKKPRKTQSVKIHTQPFYIGIHVSNVDWLIYKRQKEMSL